MKYIAMFFGVILYTSSINHYMQLYDLTNYPFDFERIDYIDKNYHTEDGHVVTKFAINWFYWDVLNAINFIVGVN